jgi:transposase
VREHSERSQPSVAADSGSAREVFVAMLVAAPTANSPTVPGADESQPIARMNLQARLPNGVVFGLRELDVQQAGVVIEALGRVRCSVSTKL